MICNVILQNSIYLKTSKLTKNNYYIFQQLTNTVKINNYQLKNRRHVFAYADDITIVTNNSKEMDCLIKAVKDSLKLVGLEISDSKTQVMIYRSNERIKFNYFGFTFLYIPKNKVRIGGIITRDGYRDERISMKGTGTHLIYPSRESYKKIKIKETINELKHSTVIKVINKVNPIIRGWVGYFA
jgi:hypothetical protein